VAKVEHHVGELFPRVGFIVTNLPLPNRAVVRFYSRPPVLTRRCWRLVSDQVSIRAGSTSRRQRFPRLYASTLSCNRTSFARKRWHDSRVQCAAYLPSLIHGSAVPRLVYNGACRGGNMEVESHRSARSRKAASGRRPHATSASQSAPTAANAPGPAAIGLVAAFTLLAAVLHVLGQSHRPLGVDEACTYWTIHAGIGDLLRGARTDGTPPLYFLIVSAVTHALGPSEAVLRLVSIVAAIALVPAIYAVARLFTTRRAAVVAAGLAALSPLVNYYAVEARSYALVQLETLAVVYVAYRAILAPQQRRWWVLLCGAQAIVLWTHNYALFLLPVPTVVSLLVGRHDRVAIAMKAAGTSALAFILEVPWFLNAMAASAMGVGDWIGSFWDATPPSAAIVRSLEVFGFGGLYPSYLPYLGEAPAVRVLALPMSIGLLVLAGVPWAERPPRPGGRSSISVLLCFLFVPLFAVWLYSWVREPVYLVGRYDTFVLPIYLILFAVGLDKIMRVRPWLGGIVVTVVLGLAATSLLTWYRVPSTADRDVMAAEELARDARPGDLIVATGYRQAVVAYYLDRAGHHAALSAFPFELERHPGWVSPERMLLDPERLISDAATLTERLVAAAKQGHTVWLLSSGHTPVDEYLYRQLARRLVVDETRSESPAALVRLKPAPDNSSPVQ
jgi:hypothetical protein